MVRAHYKGPKRKPKLDFTTPELHHARQNLPGIREAKAARKDAKQSEGYSIGGYGSAGLLQREYHFVGDCPRYTKEEEAALCERMRAGDDDAKHLLLLSMVPLGLQIAQRVYRPAWMEFEEVRDCVVDCILRCLDRLKPNKGRLTTLICWAAPRQAWRYVHLATRNRVAVTTLETLAASNFGDGSMGDFDTADKSWSTFEEASLNEAKEDLALAMSKLTERERNIIKWRFFDGKPLKDCGELEGTGVTRERIRQIETRAIKRLREFMTERRIVTPAIGYAK